MALTREELLNAIEENPEGIFGLYARNNPGAQFNRTASIRLMNFGIPVAFLNGIGMARFSTEGADEQIAKAIAEMNDTGLPWTWQVGPTSTPSDLKDRLLNFEMKPSYEMPLMTMSTKDWKPKPLPDNYKNAPVADTKTFEQWLEVAEAAFGIPHIAFDVIRIATQAIGFGEDCPVRNFIGLADGEPVCTSTVYYGNGIAGIYTVGTPEAHRGHGYGGAITEACIADAQEKGFETVFLQASKMGYPVYQRLGFEEIARVYVYVPILP